MNERKEEIYNKCVRVIGTRIYRSPQWARVSHLVFDNIEHCVAWGIWACEDLLAKADGDAPTPVLCKFFYNSIFRRYTNLFVHDRVCSLRWRRPSDDASSFVVGKSKERVVYCKNAAGDPMNIIERQSYTVDYTHALEVKEFMSKVRTLRRGFTPMQKRTLKYILDGLSTLEIAAAEGISQSAATERVKNLIIALKHGFADRYGCEVQPGDSIHGLLPRKRGYTKKPSRIKKTNQQ